jgi:spore coat polysaccharide biosynthesis protein SpsF (cytidylyltransferase family)
MRIGAIILARLDSRRLPGKALRSLCGKPLVQWAIDACRAVPGLDEIVLATTDRAQDDALAEYARQAGVRCWRGDCDDVAGRFLAAMERYELDGAIRFNGDSPLQRSALLAEAVDLFRASDVDLVSNVPGRRFPYGASVEVIGLAAMRAACAAMDDRGHREHVTSIFYQHPECVRLRRIATDDPELAGVQLAVDDENDLARASWIIAHLEGPVMDAPLAEIVRLAREYDGGRGAVA